MFASVIVLLVTDVIGPDAAFAGFSNEAPFIVASLYILAGAAEATGALERVTQFVFGRQSPGDGAAAERRDLARIVIPTTAASGFLMPLSQAAVFGGVITVLGTSTNVTVTGLLRESGREPLDLFEITPVGLPLAILGTALIVVIAPWLLPRRMSPAEADTEA